MQPLHSALNSIRHVDLSQVALHERGPCCGPTSVKHLVLHFPVVHCCWCPSQGAHTQMLSAHPLSLRLVGSWGGPCVLHYQGAGADAAVNLQKKDAWQ